MKVIGITGGAGSGKSYISQIVKEEYKYPLIDSDTVAKDLMKKGCQAYEAVVEEFGEDILDEEGEIDRIKLSNIVFHDKERLLKLNSLTHPATINKICSMLNAYQLSGKKVVFVESAIALESGYSSFCDEFWYVSSSDEDRRRRLKENRGYSDEKIDSIFSNQKHTPEMISKCTHVINNSYNATRDELLASIKLYL